MSKFTALLHTGAAVVMVQQLINGRGSVTSAIFAGLAAYYCWLLVSDD